MTPPHVSLFEPHVYPRSAHVFGLQASVLSLPSLFRSGGPSSAVVASGDSTEVSGPLSGGTTNVLLLLLSSELAQEVKASPAAPPSVIAVTKRTALLNICVAGSMPSPRREA